MEYGSEDFELSFDRGEELGVGVEGGDGVEGVEGGVAGEEEQMDGGFGEAIEDGDEGGGVPEDGGGWVRGGGGEVGEETVAPVGRVGAFGGIGGGGREGAFF